MALARALTAAVLTALAAAQSAPSRVNATAVDGAITVEWLIPTVGGEANLASFELSARPPTTGVPVPSPVYLLQDEFNTLDTNSWTRRMGACPDAYAQYCYPTNICTPGEIFGVSNGRATMKVTPGHQFSYTWYYPQEYNEYTLNGVPTLLRETGIKANESQVFQTSVMNPPIASGSGWTQAGLLIYDRVAGTNTLRPLIYMWYEIYQEGYAWNEIAIRWYSNSGYHQTQYTNVYPEKGPVSLAIHRDAAAGQWRFSYSHATWSADTWTDINFVLQDNQLITTNAAGLERAKVGLFAGSEVYANTTWSFDFFRIATLPSWTSYLQAVVANSAPNRTAALVPKGYCGLERSIVLSNLFYSRSKAYYRTTIFGLQNGVAYQVAVSSVSTTGTRVTTTLAGTFKPLPVLPRLDYSPRSSLALFLDAKSLFPAGNVYRWRDVSGNSRDFVQFTTARQPAATSNGVSFPNNFAELTQENEDTGLDLSNAGANPGNNDPGGMTWFTAYKMATDGYYWQHQVLLSRIVVNPSDIQYTWTPSLSSDDPGWDIFAFQTGYSPPWTYIHRVGMRIVVSKNTGSTNNLPSVNGVGARWEWGPQYTLTTHIDAVSPVIYTYNYYRLDQLYSTTTPTTVSYGGGGEWLLEACRNINFGETSDQCSIPDLAGGIGQATAANPLWRPGFLYLGGSPMWPNPTGQVDAATGRWYDPFRGTTGAAASHQASRATKMKLSDGTDYQYYYGRRYFYGNVYGVMIFKSAITDRRDREKIQGFIGERYGLACPVVRYDFVDTSPNPGICAPGRAVASGGACTATCNTGRRVIGGARSGESYSCQGGSFLSKGPVCGAQCPVVTLPANAANCTQVYAREIFNITSGRRLRELAQFDVYPKMTNAESDAIWSFDGSVVRGNAPQYLDECSDFSAKPTILMLNRPLWGDTSFRYVDPMTWSVKMVLEETGTQAGLAFKVSTTYVASSPPVVNAQYYRVVFTANKAGASLEHVTGTTASATGLTTLTVRTIGTPLVPSFTPRPYVDYTITVTTRGTAMKIFINNVLMYDLADSAVPHGSAGVYLGSGTASFDDLSVAGPCAVNGNCQVNEGGACLYACPEGFTAMGSASRQCMADTLGNAFYGGAPFRCMPTPPVVDNRFPTFNVFEDADVDSFVGIINATAGAANQVLLFTIIEGNNITNLDTNGRPIPNSFSFDVFDVGTCTGVVTLGTAGVMNYDLGHRRVDMVVRIAVATDQDVYTDVPVRVNILNARSPPYFAEAGSRVKDMTRLVDENRPLDYPIGLPVSAVVPEPGQVARYDILYGNSGGEFAINNATGQLTIRKVTAFNFEGAKVVPPVPTEYFLIVRATDIAFPRLQSTVQVKVVVSDADDAPFVPTQNFEVVEDQLSKQGASLGTITGAVDEDSLDVMAFSQVNMPSEFYLNSSTGEITLRSTINLGPIDDRPFEIIDGRAVRRVYRFTGRASDAKSVILTDSTVSGPITTNFPVNVYIMVNNSYGGNPIVSRALVLKNDVGRTPADLLDTFGGEELVISGRDFQSVVTITGSSRVFVNLTASAGPGSPARSYPLTGCTVRSDNEIRCTGTPAGYGKDLALVVAWGTTNLKVMVYEQGTPILMSYSPPVVKSVTWEPRAGYSNPPSIQQFSTEGVHALNVRVDFTGPMANTPVTVTYGPLTGREYVAAYYGTKVVSRFAPYIEGQFTAFVVPGVGSTLFVRVTVGNQESVINPGIFISYDRPRINEIKPLTPDFVLSGLRTQQVVGANQVIEVLGANFGRAADVITVRMVSTRTFKVDDVMQSVTLDQYPVCRKPTPGSEHSYLQCNVPSGFGFGYKLFVSVGNQTSAVLSAATYDMAYSRPNVTSLSGLGARNADTSGGQEVILTGENFGPVSLPPVTLGAAAQPNPMSITYGPTGTEYVARNCRVVATSVDRQISCQLAPGSGAGHIWRVTVAGQDAIPQPTFTSSYGAPVIISLSKQQNVANDNRGYNTPGAETVFIQGKNFGPATTFNAGRWAIYYTLTLEEVRNALNNTLTAAPDGTIRYTPLTGQCRMVTEHFMLACDTVPGAGTDLAWTVSIDNLNSTQPLLGYRRPIITDVKNMDGSAVAAANTDGGETLIITGFNFGPSTFNNTCKTVAWADASNQMCTGLIQSLRYGPTGRELSISEITIISDSEIRVRTKPGYGGPHKFVLTVADQESPLSTVGFSYARPLITAVEPNHGPAFPLSNSFQVIVRGLNFGLNDPQAEVSILLGNDGDNSVHKVIPTFEPGPDDQAPVGTSGHMVKFFLPSGLMDQRAVRAVLHPRGNPSSPLRVVSDPLDVGSNAFFDYDAPIIENVVVSVVPTDTAVVNWLLTRGGVSSDELKNIVQLVIIGSNFGPDAAVHGDGITRQIEFVPSTDGQALVYAWTDNRIVAFTRNSEGTIHVRHGGKSWGGVDTYRLSNDMQYRDRSPDIREINGGGLTAYRTAGGEMITLVVGYLSSTIGSIRVVVGTTPAVLYTTAGVEITSFADFNTAVIQPGRATSPNDPSAMNFTFKFAVPAGEGTNVPVIVVRDDTEKSDITTTINYRVPTITSYAVYNEVTLQWTTTTYSSSVVAQSTITVPTLGTKVRITGADFGLCPAIKMGLGITYKLVGAGGVACTGTVTHPTGEPVNTHSLLTFEAAPGQGHGDSAGGYTLEVAVGGQTTINAHPIKYRYLPPTLNTVTATGRTIGGTTITLRGINLGYRVNLGMNVVIGGRNCTNVAYTPAASRVAEQAMTCRLAEGSGGPHDVTLAQVTYPCTLARCSDTKVGAFKYLPPSVTAVWVNGTNAASTLSYQIELERGVLNATGVTYVDSSVYTSYLPHMARTGRELLAATRNGQDGPVRMPASGGYVVTLQGDNFGKFDFSSQHCLMLPWGGRDRTAPNALTCDNRVSSLGENEVPGFAILQWSHTRITFVMPPGYGGREIIPKIAGQEPVWPIAVHYDTPVITAALKPSRGDTIGGTPITVKGANFGTAPIDTTKPVNQNLVRNSPLVATIDEYLTKAAGPQAVALVNFFRKCVTGYRDGMGEKPDRIDRCDGGVSKHTNEEIIFNSAPGIGVNRSVTVEVVDWNSTSASWYNYTSNPVFFSYNPPRVDIVNPKPLRMDGGDGKLLELRGANFGIPPPATLPNGQPNPESWTVEEAAVSIAVASRPCYNADRFDRRGEQVVECAIDDTEVGWKNLSYTVAGQTGFNTSMEGALFVCKQGYFGKPAEKCLPCPEGAICWGFNETVYTPGMATNDTDGGIHTYPVPISGFYNMNSSDYKTSGMLANCPELMRIGTRDVCIVPCEPADACVGDNYCAEAYISKAPYYRCSTCAPGFYKRANECVKCPNSPYALVIGFVLLVLFAACAAYVLNKKKINIAFIAIFVDWAQVIAIFATSKVAWPPIVKELFHILSAFNLNIEIVAPECIVPDLQYRQKWSFIMALPVSLGVFLAFVTFVQLSFRKFIKGRKVSFVNQGTAFMSMVLLLMYVLYIYLTRNILDIFNCQPTDPPDGKTYLSAVFEECGVKGGTQDVLWAGAVAAAFFYVVMYPVGVFTLLYRNRELAMEDQLLRAKGVGNDKLTNPRAYSLRKQFSRVYYQFKPDMIYWVLAILLRKFCLAATYILFNRNANFQLAAALLVIFVAYAAQMKYAPYMGPGDFEDVLKANEIAALNGSALHAKMHDRLRNVESRGRKKVHKNLMSASGKIDANALLGLLRNWLFAYNTVEEILLFSAGTVALMGIMYASLNSTSTTFQDARDSVTWVIVGAIIITIIYFALVVCTEVYLLYTEDQRRTAMERRAKSRGKMGGKKSADEEDTGAKDREATVGAQAAVAEKMVGPVSSSFNPLFDGKSSTAGLREVVAGTDDVPTIDLWRVFRQGYQELQDDLNRLSREAAELKAAQQKMEAAAALLEKTTGQKIALPEMTDANGDKYKTGRRKNEFGPVGADSPSGTNPLAARRSPGVGQLSPRLQGGAKSLRSLGAK